MNKAEEYLEKIDCVNTDYLLNGVPITLAEILNNYHKEQCNIADVTNRTPNTKFKDNFMHPKDWNILQIAYAALLFQGAIVLFIKTILYILGYGW